MLWVCKIPYRQTKLLNLQTMSPSDRMGADLRSRYAQYAQIGAHEVDHGVVPPAAFSTLNDLNEQQSGGNEVPQMPRCCHFGCVPLFHDEG